MSSTFILLIFASSRSLFAFETEHECATKLSVDDIPNDPFCLKLDDASTKSDNNSKTLDSGTCLVDDVHVKDLGCMCGDKLTNRQEAIRARMNATCQHYDERIVGNSSPLGFCERSLTQLGKCVTFEPSEGGCEDVNAYTRESLKEKLSQINKYLLGYFSVLERTIVRVYLPSAEHRCQCLVSFSVYLLQ